MTGGLANLGASGEPPMDGILSPDAQVPAWRGRIPIAQPSLEGNEAKYVLDCITSEWVSSAGEYVDRFEADFAAFCGVTEAVSCTNGTAALHLSLAALGIGPGDEVIVPVLTYIATANAVRYCGATPVFVDVEPETMTIDPLEVERRLTPKTKAIIPVHLYGQCADMEPILDLAMANGVAVVEDAAQAHGATHGEHRAGALGTVAAFSFYGNKIITTGEGGMVTLSDPDLAKRIRLLRNQGVDPIQPYWHSSVGFNYRMTNLQAALGVAQLERAADLLQARAEVAAWYDEELGDLDQLLARPRARPGTSHAYWMYTVVLGESVIRRPEQLRRGLYEDGIETRPIFPPLHLMPPYQQAAGSFSVAERVSSQGLALPTHSRLTRMDVAYIAFRLRALLAA
jgi:perosamine synthetase